MYFYWISDGTILGETWNVLEERIRNQNDLGNKKKRKKKENTNKQFHKCICKNIGYKVYDVIFPLYLYQWGSSNVLSFVYRFLRRCQVNRENFGKNSKFRILRNMTWAESENKWVCSSLENRSLREKMIAFNHAKPWQKKSDLKHETFTFYIRKNTPMLDKVKLEQDNLGKSLSSTLKVPKIKSHKFW